MTVVAHGRCVEAAPLHGAHHRAPIQGNHFCNAHQPKRDDWDMKLRILAALALAVFLAACSSTDDSPAAPAVTWESLQTDYLPKLQQNTSSKLICGFESGVADCLDRVQADLNDLDSAATEHLGTEAKALSATVADFNSAHSLYVQGRCATAGGTLSCSTHLLKAENAAKDVRELLSSERSGN